MAKKITTQKEIGNNVFKYVTEYDKHERFFRQWTWMNTLPTWWDMVGTVFLRYGYWVLLKILNCLNVTLQNRFKDLVSFTLNL